MDGFVRKTFTAMVAGVREEAIRAGLTDAAAFNDGLRALLRTAAPDGVFCYAFFKVVGLAPEVPVTEESPSGHGPDPAS